jgi:hypothetical protein
MGLLVELFLIIALVACVFPLLTVLLELRNLLLRRSSERNFIWAFLATYCYLTLVWLPVFYGRVLLKL